MSDSSGPQADTTTTERKPPTLADIVREKTDDGRRIIDFFLDVMEGRIDGAELCHRMDAAKQLLKHRSRDAARFIAKYRDIPCEHCARRKRGPAKPRSAPVATGRVDAPDPFTQVLLTVLSGADEDLMIRVVRAQTLDGSTIIDFLDDVMQDRVDGFRCHHRIAAAKELIVHIVRDEQPAPTAVVPAHATVAPAHATVVPAKAGTHPRPRQAGPEPGSPEPVEGPAHPEPAEGPVLSTVEQSKGLS